MAGMLENLRRSGNSFIEEVGNRQLILFISYEVRLLKQICVFQVGLIYVFNLIVGTGALTMPKAFQEAGWILSLVTIIILSFMR